MLAGEYNLFFLYGVHQVEHFVSIRGDSVVRPRDVLEVSQVPSVCVCGTNCEATYLNIELSKW